MMDCLSWNCQEIGNPWTIKVFKWLNKDKCPHVVFLIKIKCRNSKLELIKSLNFDYCFTVASASLSGGLALLWNENLDLCIRSYSSRHISAHIKCLDNQCQCLIIGFYGHPETAKRGESWSLVNLLKPNCDNAWFSFGDLNKLLVKMKKWGAT